MSSEATTSTAATKTAFTTAERSMHLKHAWKLIRDENADISSHYRALKEACTTQGLRHCSAIELKDLVRSAIRKSNGRIAGHSLSAKAAQIADTNGRRRPSVADMLITGRVTVELCW